MTTTGNTERSHATFTRCISQYYEQQPSLEVSV
jgi:hypothetical protein